MKIKALLFIIGSLLFLWSACTVPFAPDIQKFDELLVVDGCITNAPGPYTVALSISSRPQQFSIFKPYSNCKLAIEDDLGNKVALMEHSPGVYQTDSSAIQGVVGRAYKLIINTPDGDVVESAPEIILKELEIKSIDAELVRKNNTKMFDGYQFYVEAEAPTGKDKYLLWRTECTYRFDMDYYIKYYYDNGLHPVNQPDTFLHCYRTVQLPNFYICNPNEQITPEVKHIPLNYEGNTTKALTVRYCLKVIQLTIGKEAFNYWEVLKKIQNSGGDLYTQQPYQVKNNLTNLSNSGKPVLGYFMVAGASEERIFLDRPPISFQIEDCPPYFFGFHCDFACLLKKMDKEPQAWPVFIPPSEEWVPESCIDCRKTGFQKKPAYWKD